MLKKLKNTVVEEVGGTEGQKMGEDLKASKAAVRNPVTSATPEKNEDTEKRKPIQRVNATVFARVSGHRPEVAAGFLYHTKKQKLGARSVAEWQTVWDDFMNRPVK